MITLEELEVLLACIGGFIAIGFGIIAIIGAREITKR